MTIVRTIPETTVESSFAVYHLFCRLMLQASLIAVPAYLAIFMMAIPFDIDVGVERGLILLTPVFEFFVAAVLYSLGFLTILPSPERDFDGLARLRNRVMHRKRLLILLGSMSLSLGILSGSLLLVKAHL